MKQGSGEREWWAVKSVFSGSHPWRSRESLALWNAPTSACRYTLFSAHQMCDSACQYDWSRAWLVLPPQPATLPSLRNTHPHRHIHSYPSFPSVTLFSADSSIASPKGRPLIATVRWDGPRGIEFQMTGVWSWYGRSGSCWGTVLPLLWPPPWPLLQPAEQHFKIISSSGARTTRHDGSVTWYIHLPYCVKASSTILRGILSRSSSFHAAI